jgi:hypothetical protein
MSRIAYLIGSLFLLLVFVNQTKLVAQPVVNGDYQVTDSLIIEEIASKSGNTVVETSEFDRTPSVSLSLGTSFASLGYGFSGLSTYVAPTVSLPVSKKFSVRVGMGYSNMWMNTPSEFGIPYNSSYGSVFVSGSYQVNENLVVSGTAYKTFLLNSSSQNQNQLPGSSFNDFSSQGFLFDAEYKVNDKFRIGVSVEYRDQNTPSFYPNGCAVPTTGIAPFQVSPYQFGN